MIIAIRINDGLAPVVSSRIAGRIATEAPVVAIHRMRHDPRSRAYANRRKAAGSTDRETRRCLKNYLARHLWRVMERHQPRAQLNPVTQPGIAA